MSEVNISAKTDILMEIVQHDPVEYNAQMQNAVREYAHISHQKPVFFISCGTAGIVAGAEKTKEEIKSYLADRSLEASIIKTGSLGLSSYEPVLGIQFPDKNRLFFHNVKPENIVPILDDVYHNRIPAENVLGQSIAEGKKPWNHVPLLDDMDFFRLQKRVVLSGCGYIDPTSIEEYIAINGYKSFMKTIKHYTYWDICDLIEKSELRGRSGSGFPTGKKWKIAHSTPADNKYLVCNAEESDPGAFMDRAIMEGNPHLLLEGMCIAAYGIGASKAYIYIRSEYTIAIERLEKAIQDANELGLLGHNIFGSGFNLEIILRKGPGAFVCGEETALIASLEGKRGMPKSKPPYPAVKGLHGMPTIINNVETLSTIPRIIEKGPGWFKEIGVEENYGTKIFAVSGKSKYPGLIEVPLGTNLKDLIFKIAGGVSQDKEFKAIQLGGPSGYILPESQLDVELNFESFKEKGVRMGSGGIVVIDEDDCVLDLVKYYMNFMKKQSCGKCIPCREGSRRMSEILESITRKPVDEKNNTTLERFKGVMQLSSLAEVMHDTSLCGLGQNAPNPVLSTLEHFRNEYEEHIFDRNCRSNVCTELRTYFINVDSCTGCSVCAKKCPVDAIIGTPLHPYFIVQEKCTGCGLCYESCKFSAISYK